MDFLTVSAAFFTLKSMRKPIKMSLITLVPVGLRRMFLYKNFPGTKNFIVNMSTHRRMKFPEKAVCAICECREDFVYFKVKSHQIIRVYRS